MPSRRMAGAFALVLAGAAAIGQTAAAQDSSNAAVGARAEALIARMTPDEKAAQLTVSFVMPGSEATAAEAKAAAGAGALLLISDPRVANHLQHLAVERSRLGIPMLFGFDVLHGLSTIFPVPIALAASWDPDLVERSQAIAAAEARAVGITWTFGPMIDITRDPRWGRIVEGAGEDPYLGGAMAAAHVRGFQGPRIGAPGRIIAGPKHFAGYGASLGGRDYDEAYVSDDELWNVYLPPFKAAIDAGAGNVMAAYMALNGIPAAANRWLLTQVLRKTFGFRGWTVSDNSSVAALQTQGLTIDDKASATAALSAGLDMEMVFASAAYAQLPQALKEGAISPQRLDEAVRRVLEAKIRLGLFERPYVDEAAAFAALRLPENLDAAQVAAERSAVLLRNEGDLLPLDRRKLRSLAVIGPLADSARDAAGPWVFNWNQPATQSILAGIRDKLGSRVRVTYAPGVKVGSRRSPNPMTMMDGKVARPEPADETAGIAEAVAAANAADVAVVVVGESYDMIAELGSRATLDLPGRQQELLDAVVATGKPVVVLVMNGRPLDLKDTRAAAILDIWYPGSRGGSAVADLLVGDAAPGGKLPFTWPRNASQIPMYYARLSTHSPRGVNARYWDQPGGPAFPFGHGLTYTTFAYSNVSLDRSRITPGEEVTISFDVRNDGRRAGDEVAQLYIHQMSGTAARPVRELKGFHRVTLKPGETRRLTFRLGPNELSYWNAATRDWALDESSFAVAVGGNSEAKFTATFAVARPDRVGLATDGTTRLGTVAVGSKHERTVTKP